MLEFNIKKVKENITRALNNRVGTKVTGDKVTITAVTKNHEITAVSEAFASGLTNIGENRVQEAMKKRETYPNTGYWHLIGHLQRNKVKHALKVFDIIESVDSEELLGIINKRAAQIGKVQDILLQINLTKEKQKTGFDDDAYKNILEKLVDYSNIQVRGLMVVGWATDNIEDNRPIFRETYNRFVELQKKLGKEQCNMLSMGMSDDYVVAIEEGANYIRLGTVLFGKRDYSK